MFPRLAAVVALAAPLLAAPRPDGLRIVVEARSDAAPFWSAYLMDLRRLDIADWELRWVRVAPANSYCSRINVKADSRRIGNAAVRRLFKGLNPCDIQQEQLSRVYPKNRPVDWLEHPADFWIAADCSGEERRLKAPAMPWEKYKSLDKRRHVLAQLRDLYWDLGRAAGFGDRSPFANLDDDEDLRLQRQAEPIVPELRSGRFDIAPDSSWADLLEDYAGPRHPADLRPRPRIVLASSSEGVDLVDRNLEYPPLAKLARIQGRVTVEYEVEQGSGLVRVAEGASSGHPLLVKAAESSLQTWRVANHEEVGVGPFVAAIEYNLENPQGCRD